MQAATLACRQNGVAPYKQEVSQLAREGRFDYLVIESTGISEPQQVRRWQRRHSGSGCGSGRGAATAAQRWAAMHCWGGWHLTTTSAAATDPTRLASTYPGGTLAGARAVCRWRRPSSCRHQRAPRRSKRWDSSHARRPLSVLHRRDPCVSHRVCHTVGSRASWAAGRASCQSNSCNCRTEGATAQTLPLAAPSRGPGPHIPPSSWPAWTRVLLWWMPPTCFSTWPASRRWRWGSCHRCRLYPRIACCVVLCCGVLCCAVLCCAVLALCPRWHPGCRRSVMTCPHLCPGSVPAGP